MQLSLTKNLPNDGLIAWNENGSISHAQFIADVTQLANKLPNRKYAINLCEQRYSFMVAFAAVVVRQQTNLLPQSRIVENINAVAENYSEHYCISETILDGIRSHQIEVEYNIAKYQKTKFDKVITIPTVDSEHVAAIVFTSGSTGKPQANKKSWGELVTGARMSAEHFGFIDKPAHLVATVPPQHMYGLETSILYSLQCACPIYAGRPFYPDDIRRAAESISSPVVLVTTPVHLRACNGAVSIRWQNIKFIISATAPLRVELAEQVSAKMNTTVKEIYGCTETGAVASREPVKSEVWELFNGVDLYHKNDKTFIRAKHFNNDIELNDLIEIIGEQNFRLVGRDADLINIAGKRGSLADITLKLQSIEGIKDAVVYFPESTAEVNRLMAFVVTDGLDEKVISTELANKIDSVFIPRPIYRVKKLPYNETGKLSQKLLQDLHRQCKHAQKLNNN